MRKRAIRFMAAALISLPTNRGNKEMFGKSTLSFLSVSVDLSSSVVDLLSSHFHHRDAELRRETRRTQTRVPLNNLVVANCVA